ncbi:MAG: CoA-binding protein [Desulfobacterales bacterium]|nr:MAG: CoA-binding protein [Desulfobacterales bacterium]
MEPTSVALIGISRKSGPGAFNLMENMVKFGFDGEIFPVNPNSAEILGKKAYPNVRAVKKKIDLAVISTPRETTLRILEDCVAAKIKAAIVVNQGFTDADRRGKEMQAQMTAMARTDGIRILGPNTLGVLNSFNNFTTSFMPVPKVRVPVGLICQSGIYFVGPQKFSGVFGKGIDLGNACDIGFYDALKYLADDPNIKIIAIHMEGLNQGKEFLALAAKVVKDKPLVVHKSGSSRTGARAAMSHTGSLAGNYRLLKAALKQAGVSFLEDGGQMPHAVKTLLNLPGMKGSRVGVITYSGGAGIMVSDGLERHGLQLASFSAATISQVAKLSPSWMPLSNPLDIWPAVMLHGARKAYTLALKAVLQDTGVDAVLCIAIAPLPQFSFLDVSESLNEALEAFPPTKPVIVWTYGPNPQEVEERFESRKRIMTYPTLELATWALSLLRERYRITEN